MIERVFSQRRLFERGRLCNVQVKRLFVFATCLYSTPLANAHSGHSRGTHIAVGREAGLNENGLPSYLMKMKKDRRITIYENKSFWHGKNFLLHCFFQLRVAPVLVMFVTSQA